MYAYVGLLFALVERAIMQRLVKCCLRAVFSSAALQLPARGTQASRAACEYSALVRCFIARKYSAAAAGDALTLLLDRACIGLSLSCCVRTHAHMVGKICRLLVRQ
jgi:hypothetical protein